MDPNKSPVTKTSPLIIRLSTTSSPAKQDITEIETRSEVPKHAPACSTSVASTRELRSNCNVSSSVKNIVQKAKSPKQGVEKTLLSSGKQARSRKKRTKDLALKLDMNATMLDIDDLIKPIKQSNTSLSEQSSDLTPCDELGKVNDNVRVTKRPKLVCESTDFDNKLEKCAISSSNNLESSKLTEVQSVSFHKTSTSRSIKFGKKTTNVVAKNTCDSNRDETLSHEKLAMISHQAPTHTNLFSTIEGDAKDYTNSTITAIKVNRKVVEDTDTNVGSTFGVSNLMHLAELTNSDLKESLEVTNSDLKESLEVTLESQLPGFLKDNDQPIVPIQSSLLSEGIDKNKITIPEIKVEKECDSFEDVQLKPSNKEDIFQQPLSEQNLELSDNEAKFELMESALNRSSSSESAFHGQMSLNKLSTLVPNDELGVKTHGNEAFSEEAIQQMGFIKEEVVESEQILISELPEIFNSPSEQMDPIGWSITETSSLAFDENLGATIDRDIAISEEYLFTKSSEDYKCNIVGKGSRNNEVLQDEIFSERLQHCAPSPSTSESTKSVTKVMPLQNYQSLLQEESSNEAHEIDSPGSLFSPEENTEQSIDATKFKKKEYSAEERIKKRHYRRHASASHDLEEEADDLFNCPREVSNHPWDEQITANDVSELEITELERIRESLRMQLSEGNEDTTDSADSSNIEHINVTASPKLNEIKLELNEEQCPLATTALKEDCISSKETSSESTSSDKLDVDQTHYPLLPLTLSSGKLSLNEHSTVEEISDLRFEFGRCPFEKPVLSLNKQKSPSGEISGINLDPVLEQCRIPFTEEAHLAVDEISEHCEFTELEDEIAESPGEADLLPENNESSIEENKSLGEAPCETAQGRLVSLTDKPPLVMHSSNLLFNYGLDNRHGGGGIETTDLDEDQAPPPKKKLKRDCSNYDVEGCKPQENCQSVDEQMLDYDESSIHCESSTNNVSEDYLTSEQNGVMEFDILDEFESDGNDEPNDGNTDSDSSTDAFDMDEIDALLDAKLREFKTLDPNNELAHEEKQKVVLKVKGKDHFEVLPEGWIEVTHNCGMPIYLHKQTRVCSMSKPYFLGPGSTRKHKIPMSAIPCLHYLKETEKEKLKADIEDSPEAMNAKEESENTPVVDTNNHSDAVNKDTENTNENTIANGIFPSAKLQSAKDTKESGSLDFLAVRKYCEKRFDFQKITVKRFSTWSGRRKHQKKLKHEQRPFLPDDTKLITCPLYGASEKSTVSGTNVGKREFIMNPSGKSPVCILHEYVQHTLRLQPKYEFKELENARTPYGAVVVIDGIEYGNGYGSSKKLAKSDAARAALEILIPNMKLLPKEENREVQDVEFFDQVRVEDPRVSDLSVKAGQPYPYQILLECLKRNYGMGDTEIDFSMKNIKHQKNEFHMKVGKHVVSVVCKNKRDGKHRASQAILQKLHPHISSWGSLLRMYGKGSCKTLKEKKEEEQRITELQSKACANKPNTSILCKLKEEMMKYREKVKSKKPIGKLIPERMEFLTTSSSNLKSLEL